MKIFPDLKLQDFDELKAGELFLIADYEAKSCFAIKTAEGTALILGPEFGGLVPEPMTIPMNGSVCLSYGKDFIVSFPDNSAKWSRTNPGNIAIALTKTGVYLRFNGLAGRGRYLACFLDLNSGAITEGMPDRLVAFTESWEISISSSTGQLRPILRFPLGLSKEIQ
jgi:hypothetical protein